MTCKACGYDDNQARRDSHFQVHPEKVDEFIDLAVVERAPFFVGTPDVWPDGMNTPAIKRGTPVKLYACPKCGTVKMEV